MDASSSIEFVSVSSVLLRKVELKKVIHWSSFNFIHS